MQLKMTLTHSSSRQAWKGFLSIVVTFLNDRWLKYGQVKQRCQSVIFANLKELVFITSGSSFLATFGITT